MEISLQINPKIAKTVPSLARGMNHKLKSVSCKLAMPKTTKAKSNFYEVLSLGSKSVGLDEIKKAYRSMALRYHPDVCVDPLAKEESTRRFIELQKAYETLSNPISREMYDFELGLIDTNLVFGVDNFGVDGRRSVFAKEVWEDQLRALRRKSQVRMERRQYV
ncbi:hypothetical protein UlMin_038203 [Ulmus minor]